MLDRETLIIDDMSVSAAAGIGQQTWKRKVDTERNAMQGRQNELLKQETGIRLNKKGGKSTPGNSRDGERRQNKRVTRQFKGKTQRQRV